MPIKKVLFSTFVSLAIVTVFGVLIWFLTLRGAMALVRIDNLFKLVVITFGCLGLVLLLLAALRWKTANRHRTLKTSLTVAVLVFTLLGFIIPSGAAAYITAFPDSPVGDTPARLIMLDNTNYSDRQNYAIIKNTRDKQVLSLWYEADGQRKVLKDNKPVNNHIFVLEGLKPDAEYTYQISGESMTRFKTAPFSTSNLRLALGGDAHFGAATNRRDVTEQIISHIAEPKHSFNLFVSLGDLVEMGGSNRQWMDAFNALAPITATMPTVFVPGNHDTMFTGLPRFEYFCSPSVIKNASGSSLYYRLDLGNIHLFIVNLEWSAESFTPKQAEWLEKQLKSIPANDWKIVLTHGFLYSSGFVYHGRSWTDNPETIAALAPLFEKYKVDIVFNGHNHHMETLKHSGVTYITIGTLGGLPDPERTYISPASIWYQSGKFGFADVNIKSNEAEIIYRSPDFEILHSFKIKK